MFGKFDSRQSYHVGAILKKCMETSTVTPMHVISCINVIMPPITHY